MCLHREARSYRSLLGQLEKKFNKTEVFPVLSEFFAGLKCKTNVLHIIESPLKNETPAAWFALRDRNINHFVIQ